MLEWPLYFPPSQRKELSFKAELEEKSVTMFGLERKHNLKFDFKESWLGVIFLFLLGTTRTELGRHVLTQVLLLRLSDRKLGDSKQQPGALDHSHKDEDPYINHKTLYKK